MSVKEQVSLPTQRICSRCKFVSSQEVCKACVLLESLNKGLPKLGIGKSSKAKRMLEDYNAKQNNIGQAIDEINDEFKKNICISNVKVSRSKKKAQCIENSGVITDNENSKCCKKVQSNEENVHTNNHETECCGENICRTNNKANECRGVNSKAEKLLAEYGIPGSSDKNNAMGEINSMQDQNGSGEEINVKLLSNDINLTETCDTVDEFEVDPHTINDVNVIKEEDETCAGACGKIDSLHIGF